MRRERLWALRTLPWLTSASDMMADNLDLSKMDVKHFGGADISIRASQPL